MPFAWRRLAVTFYDYVILSLASALAGAINSIAGGGTLVTFPALLHVLGNSAEAQVIANATSTTALLPGSLAALSGYRVEFAQVRHWAKLLIGPSLVGGFIGSLLVTVLDASVFEALVPWLILTASALFLIQPLVARSIGIGKPHAPATPGTKAGVVVFQFFVSVYGGYFGAGIGILMLSGLALMGLSDIHQMNSLKALLGSAINLISVVVFAYQGTIDWRLAAPMAAAALLGGFSGALVARRLNRTFVRIVVVAIGFGLAAHFFAQR